MADIPKPITKKDAYYTYLINGTGKIPKPITREDTYLYYLCQNGFGGDSGGGVTAEMIDKAVDAALKIAKDYTNSEIMKLDAESVGALPLTGGEMDGDIKFESLEGDYNIKYPAKIQMKYEGVIDANGGYINRVEELSFDDKTHPVRDSAVLTTKEQVNANVDTTNVAAATAVKEMVGEIKNNLSGKNNFNATFKRNYDYKTASGWQNILQWMDKNIRTGYLAENISNGGINLHLNNERGDIYINGNSIAYVANSISSLINAKEWRQVLSVKENGIHEVLNLYGAEILLIYGYVFRIEDTMTMPLSLLLGASGAGAKILFSGLEIETVDNTHISVKGIQTDYLFRIFAR
ncbi:MAG: hypothetical protein K2N73_10610 [Lachnospiraceae bacterium]|nr:hypothetical protein [Lachnospiraceae bacterium]